MLIRLATLGIGALAMYYFDPVSGKRRRTKLRDQLEHAQHRKRLGQRRPPSALNIDPSQKR